MLPGTRDITVYQGDDWDMLVGIKDTTPDPDEYQDLTGFTALAQIRVNEDTNTVLATITIEFADQGILPGRLVASLTGVQTAALPASGGMYDIELTSPVGYTGTLKGTHTYVKGKVTVQKQVSRP